MVIGFTIEEYINSTYVDAGVLDSGDAEKLLWFLKIAHRWNHYDLTTVDKKKIIDGSIDLINCGSMDFMLGGFGFGCFFNGQEYEADEEEEVQMEKVEI